MLRITDISKSFKKKTVLRHIDLEIHEGECFGLVGPNGAGKTTLLHLICGLLTPDSGKITFLGQEITRNSLYLKKQIGIVPQEIALYENLSPVDNLRYFGELYGLTSKIIMERSEALLKWMELYTRRHDKLKSLSTGMKRRVNFIAGLLHAPPLLLLDEPTVGVDPQARRFIYDKIEALRAAGNTILYATHYIPEVERLCQRVAILDEGNLVAAGTPEDVVRKAGIHEQLETLVVEGRKSEWLPVNAMRLSPGHLESAFFQLTGKALRES